MKTIYNVIIGKISRIVLWRNDVRIYVARVIQVADNEIDEVVSLLDEKRRDKVLRIKNERERNRSLSAGLLLRYAFLNEDHTLEEWKNVSIDNKEYGKPFIKMNNGQMFHYSLSHSGDYVVCATAKSEVGVDIQQMIDDKPIIGIAKRFYSLEEYERIKESQDSVRDCYRMWAAKESYVKYTGRGIGAGISKVIVSKNYDRIYDTVTSREGKLGRYENIEGYVMFVCSEDETFPDDFITISDLRDICKFGF